MDLELATNLIFEGACCGRQGLLSRRPKAVGGPLHSNCAAMPPPHQQLQSTPQGGVLAPNSSCERVFVAVAPTRCCACVLRASCAAKLGHAGVV